MKDGSQLDDQRRNAKHFQSSHIAQNQDKSDSCLDFRDSKTEIVYTFTQASILKNTNCCYKFGYVIDWELKLWFLLSHHGGLKFKIFVFLNWTYLIFLAVRSLMFYQTFSGSSACGNKPPVKKHWMGLETVKHRWMGLRWFSNKDYDAVNAPQESQPTALFQSFASKTTWNLLKPSRVPSSIAS